MNNKVPIKSITFEWKEGRTEKKGLHNLPIVCHSFCEANNILKEWSKEAPKQGYDKISYIVEWADGKTYKGRYDLHHYSQRQENPSGEIDLADATISHLNFIAGRVTGLLLQQRMKVKKIFDELEEEAKILLNNYCFDDLCSVINENDCRKSNGQWKDGKCIVK